MILPFSNYLLLNFLSIICFMPQRNGRGRRKQNGDSVDRAFVRDHHAAGKGDVVSVPGDYSRRQPSFMLVQSPPRNFAQGITWITDTWFSQLNISGAGALTESNFAYVLSNLGNASSLVSIFDQYCVYAVFTSFTLTPVAITTAAVSYGQLFTAIDYDNANTIGSVAAITQYSSMEFSEIIPGKSHERFLKPCVGAIIGAGNASAVTTSPQRMWVNSAVTSQPHYGLRVIVVGNSTTQTYTLDITHRFIVGFRNTI